MRAVKPQQQSGMQGGGQASLGGGELLVSICICSNLCAALDRFPNPAKPRHSQLQIIVVNYIPSTAAPTPESSSPILSPAPPPPPPNTETVVLPALSFTTRLPDYAAPSAFDAAAHAAYGAALATAVVGIDARVLVTGVRQGSVLVDTMVLFLVRLSGPAALSQPASVLPLSLRRNIALTRPAHRTDALLPPFLHAAQVSNGNTDAAKALQSTLADQPGSVFPAATWGEPGCCFC